MKVFNKIGKRSFKDGKLEKDLQQFFTDNPDKYQGFSPANTPEELKQYHDLYMTEDAVVVEETTHESFRDSMKPEVEPELFPQDDPMNRHEPKIRDYVLDDGFKDTKKEDTKQSTYDEPKSFEDSFNLPDDNIQGDNKQGSGPSISQPKPKQPNAPADPDAKVKRKSKKKFTKYAVDAVCALAERGIVWYSTKDITQEKLAEYVANDEIAEQALELIVMIDANTKGNVREFFQSRCESAAEFAKFTLEEKEDLAEALEDFMEYKKIEINPTINILVLFLGMAFERALKAITIRVETNSILVQLKDMKTNSQDYDYRDPATEPTTTTNDPAAPTIEEDQQTEIPAE